MIIPEKIEPETVEVYHDEHGFVGKLNEYEFNGFRVKIKKASAEGYYVLKDGKKHYIDKDGRISDWNFFALYIDQLSELL